MFKLTLCLHRGWCTNADNKSLRNDNGNSNDNATNQ